MFRSLINACRGNLREAGITSEPAQLHSCAGNSPAAPLTAVLVLMTGCVPLWHRCTWAAGQNNCWTGVKTCRIRGEQWSPFIGKLYGKTRPIQNKTWPVWSPAISHLIIWWPLQGNNFNAASVYVVHAHKDVHACDALHMHYQWCRIIPLNPLPKKNTPASTATPPSPTTAASI